MRTEYQLKTKEFHCAQNINLRQRNFTVHRISICKKGISLWTEYQFATKEFHSGQNINVGYRNFNEDRIDHDMFVRL